MTHEQRKRLSAMADDGAGPGQATALLAEIEQSSDLRACWQRYHLIGSILRGEEVSVAYCGVGDRVRAGLKREVRPPHRRLGDRLRALSLNPGLMLPAYGGAAAVALSIGMVGLGLLPPEQSPPGRTDQLATAAFSMPAGGSADRAVVPQTSNRPRARWQATSPALSSKLDRLLIGHRERASASGISGFVPYAAVVGNGVP